MGGAGKNPAQSARASSQKRDARGRFARGSAVAVVRRASASTVASTPRTLRSGSKAGCATASSPATPQDICAACQSYVDTTVDKLKEELLDNLKKQAEKLEYRINILEDCVEKQEKKNTKAAHRLFSLEYETIKTMKADIKKLMKKTA